MSVATSCEESNGSVSPKHSITSPNTHTKPQVRRQSGKLGSLWKNYCMPRNKVSSDSTRHAIKELAEEHVNMSSEFPLVAIKDAI